MMATPQQAGITFCDGDEEGEAGPTVAEEDGVEVEMVTVAQTYTPKCSDEKRSKQLKARRGRGRKKKAIKDVPVPPTSPSFDVRVFQSTKLQLQIIIPSNRTSLPTATAPYHNRTLM